MHAILRASKADLEQIVEIYNQSVTERNATADLSPVSVKSREAWFDAHGSNRPIYVLKANADNKAQNENGGQILAWASLSDYYPREAYDITAEISVYIRKSARGKGFGKILAKHLIENAPNFGIKNIVAVIFKSNTASLNLFTNLGFSKWGELPNVCDMSGKFESVIILGKKLD